MDYSHIHSERLFILNMTVWNKEWPLTHAGISGLSCGNYVKH